MNWQAYTWESRNIALEKIKSAISENDGYILNHEFYSDLAMMISVEIDGTKLNNLNASLSHFLTVEMEKTEKGLTGEILLNLNVTFGNESGNLRNKIPE